MLGFIHLDDVETERSWLYQGGLNKTGEQGVLHMRHNNPANECLLPCAYKAHLSECLSDVTFARSHKMYRRILWNT